MVTKRTKGRESRQRRFDFEVYVVDGFPGPGQLGKQARMIILLGTAKILRPMSQKLRLIEYDKREDPSLSIITSCRTRSNCSLT